MQFSVSAAFVVSAFALSSTAAAQAPAFQTPGMPVVPQRTQPASDATGQTGRFSNLFNPAIGFVLDTVVDYLDADEGEDGFDFSLRSGELAVSSWIDPSAWLYGVVVYADDEVALEEGAVHYTGLGSNTTLRAGRFFVDFGKQMQAHVHDLRTLERPAVLREYLGDELGGEGVQFDQWFAYDDTTVVRYSLGIFQSLLGEGEEDEEAGPFAVEGERKDIDELGLTARLTGFTDVGSSGTLQLGASARLIPEFGFELGNGAALEDLSNSVFGLDLTYGWADDTNTRTWTAGAEFLANTGDLGAEVDDAGTPLDPSDDLLSAIDEDVSGFYAFVEHQWSRSQSAGVQWSWLELPSADSSELSELDLHYTHRFSEFQRLRASIILTDADEPEDEGARFALQYTNFVGAHSHGLNW